VVASGLQEAPLPHSPKGPCPPHTSPSHPGAGCSLRCPHCWDAGTPARAAPPQPLPGPVARAQPAAGFSLGDCPWWHFPSPLGGDAAGETVPSVGAEVLAVQAGGMLLRGPCGDTPVPQPAAQGCWHHRSAVTSAVSGTVSASVLYQPGRSSAPAWLNRESGRPAGEPRWPQGREARWHVAFTCTNPPEQRANKRCPVGRHAPALPQEGVPAGPGCVDTAQERRDVASVPPLPVGRGRRWRRAPCCRPRAREGSPAAAFSGAGARR